MNKTAFSPASFDIIWSERAIYNMGFESGLILPESAWTADYYDPMEDLLAKKIGEWSGIPEAMKVIEDARSEIDMFHKYSSYYDYAFLVMRRPVE